MKIKISFLIVVYVFISSTNLAFSDDNNIYDVNYFNQFAPNQDQVNTSSQPTQNQQTYTDEQKMYLKSSGEFLLGQRAVVLEVSAACTSVGNGEMSLDDLKNIIIHAQSSLYSLYDAYKTTVIPQDIGFQQLNSKINLSNELINAGLSELLNVWVDGDNDHVSKGTDMVVQGSQATVDAMTMWNDLAPKGD